MRRQVQVGASARDAAALAAVPTEDTAEVAVQAAAQDLEVENALAHVVGRRATAAAEVGVQGKEMPEVLLAGAAGQSKVLQSLN